MAIKTPSVEAMDAHIKTFDDENSVLEDALKQLIATFPLNSDRSHVFLKTVNVNYLYATQIPLYSDRVPTVFEVADHIHGLKDIDSELKQGSPNAVRRIRKVTVKGKTTRYNYSFATKYCSWHNPEAYPIYSSEVDAYLWYLRKEKYLDPFRRKNLWDYPKLKEIVANLRERFSLQDYTFKKIDKFLYREGSKLLA